MKTTVPYNFKKAILFGALVALPFAFAGCEKENTTPNNNGGNGGTNPGGGTQPKHNVELKYNSRTEGGMQNVSMDTINKYNKDETVDSIFMIPDPIDQFATNNATQMQNAVKYFRERHNVNPKKVFGKGDLEISKIVKDDHPEIVRFFADTLKYNVR